jgi:hypothetical protein
MSRLVRPIWHGVLIAAACSFPLWGQPDRGAVTGLVTDSTDAVIRGAKVQAVQVSTGVAYGSTTNESGRYLLPNLPVGEYRVVVETTGFKTLVRSSVHVDLGPALRVDVQLVPGDLKETVRVSARVSPLITENAEEGTLLDSRRVLDFPLTFAGGRSPEMFAYKLLPGAEGDNWISRLDGSPSFSKEVLLDGASVTTYIAGHFGESSVSSEAIEEFRIQTSGMNAEYGRTYGGLFNFVMKSGTNLVHGSATGLLRNEWMDANSFVNNAYGRPRDRDRRNDYALSFGGPVFLPRLYSGVNKTFFYIAYEKYHERNAGLGSANVTVPLPAWWNGDMSRYLTNQVVGQDAQGHNVLAGEIFDPASSQTVGGKLQRNPFPGNIIPQSRISQVSRRLGKIMQQYYAPQVRQSDGQFAMVNNSFFPVANTASFDQRQLSLKVDHNLSARQKLSGSWAYVDRPRILLDQGGVWDPSSDDGGPLSRARSQDVHSIMARLSHDYTLRPNLFNNILLAFNRQINPSQSTHLGQDGAAALGLSGLTPQGNFPEIVFQGGNGMSLPTLGYTANDVLAATSYEFSDTLSWNHGRHLLKFGFDARRNMLNDRNTSGPAQFVFNSTVTGLPGFNKTGSPFASMLLGAVSSASVNIDTPTGSRFRYAALFAQDDFKVTRRWTLNFGLRWEYQPVQTEVYNRISSFCTTCIDPYSGLPGAMEYAGSGPGRTGETGFASNHWKNFGPRFGMAYQVQPAVVFRAAYGIFFTPRVPNDYSGVPYFQKMGFTQQNAVNDTGNGLPAFYWDQGYHGTTISATPDPSLADFVYGPVYWDSQGGKVPYVQQWNAGFQVALPAQLVLDIGYFGNKATGLYANALENINQIPAAALKLGDMLGDWVASAADIPAAAKVLGARYPFGNSGTYIPLQQTLQPFPQVPYWSPVLAYNAPLGFSTYHALQITVNRRLSSGLNWLADYTLSKTISNLDSAFNTYSNYGRPLDYYNLGLEKSISPYDQTHSVKFGVRYELPVGRGKKLGTGMSPVLNALLGGWNIQLLGQYASGFPLSFYGTGVPNANFATNRATLLNSANQSLYAGFNASAFDVSAISTPGATANRYVNTALVQDPGRYTLGNASFATAQIRGFGFANEDLGLHKDFLIRERFRAQFRAEFLNLLNRHRYNSIDTNAASPLFGQVTGLDGSFYRQTQIGARLDF